MEKLLSRLLGIPVVPVTRSVLDHTRRRPDLAVGVDYDAGKSVGVWLL